MTTSCSGVFECVSRFFSSLGREKDRRTKISALRIYPIKSCGEVEVEEAVVERGGLQYDREFALVDSDGEVLTQKTFEKLATIRPKLVFEDGGGQGGRVGAGAAGVNSTLIGLELRSTLSAWANDPPLFVDLIAGADDHLLETLWAGNNVPLAATVYPEADTWLTKKLGRACRLVRLKGARFLRNTRLAAVSEKTDECRYHDGSPLSILTEASVRDLNRKLTGQVPITRFRANIIVSSGSQDEAVEPYQECRWARLLIGGRVPLRTLMDDYRCTMVTIDQNEGPSCGTRPHGHEPFMVLKKYRGNVVETHGPVARDNPNFAVYAGLDETFRMRDMAKIAPGVSEEKVVRVGDVVEVIEEIGGYSSIWRYNEAEATEKFSMTEDRFWVCEGPK